jgi:hypothetical protein
LNSLSFNGKPQATVSYLHSGLWRNTVAFGVVLVQARRADKSIAGGVSHRFARVKNQRPEGPKYL